MKWKLAIGFLLMALSISGIYLWETKYRDEITMTEVLVASHDIEINEYVDSDDFEVIKVNPESVIENALTSADLPNIYGKLAAVNIYTRQQLRQEDFVSEEDLSSEGYRHFVIPSEWIFSKSSTLKENEYVKIYALPDEYDVSPVNKVVTDGAGETDCRENPDNYFLGTYRIAVLEQDKEIEILATIEDYFRLYETFDFLGKQLILAAEDE